MKKNPKMRNQMIILLSIENKNQIIMDENCMTQKLGFSQDEMVE